MPPKPDNELTQVESLLLATAARLLAAIKRVSESPSTPDQLAHYNAKVEEELVSPHIKLYVAYVHNSTNHPS
jgi:hypothetical protein